MHTPASLELIHVEDRILGGLSLDTPVDPRRIQFLLRLYATTDRDDLAERVGLALAAALRDYPTTSSVPDRAAWLELFVDARAIADDERVAAAVADLAAGLQGAWSVDSIAEAAAALDACLRAAMLEEHQSLAAAAVDQLERVVARAYRPGSGVVGAGADQIWIAGALLSAYQLSGRLPYPMLAEEIVAAARPLLEAASDFTLSCHAARVLCRLAVLHDDDDYRRAAIVAPHSDYRRDAAMMLERQSAVADRLGVAGAIYGVALLELESSDPHPND